METIAYEQGFDAAKYSNAENPYEVDTEEYNDWIDGYNSWSNHD